MKNLFIIIIVTLLLSSCSNYYKASLAGPATSTGIEDLKKNNRFFILRYGTEVFAMNNISFSADNKIMQCRLDSLPPYEHRLHLTKGQNGKMKYKKAGEEDESAVLNEVHVYVDNTGIIATGSYTLPVDRIKKIEVLEKDISKTAKSKALGVVLGVSGSLVVLIGIGAAIASSITIF